jgi:hypothetical protein
LVSLPRKKTFALIILSRGGAYKTNESVPLIRAVNEHPKIGVVKLYQTQRKNQIYFVLLLKRRGGAKYRRI